MNEIWFAGGIVADGSGAAPSPADVCVRDGVIIRIGTAPADATTIDLDGMLLTPGLIDAHVHLGLSSPIRAQFGFQLSAAEIAADIFTTASRTLDAGFTTVRDTGGIDGGVVDVIAKGKVRGSAGAVVRSGAVSDRRPRILLRRRVGADGAVGDASLPGLAALSLMAGNADELRRNVRESFRRGATFLKLCVTGGVVGGHDSLDDTQFTSAEIAVAVEEAAARGTYVTVHAHNNAGIRNAVEAGVRCVEHGTDIDEPTATLMREHDVALVPTFAVIEQIMDPEALDVDPSTRDRLADTRRRMVEALRISRAARVRIGLGSDLLGAGQHRRGEELRLRAPSWSRRCRHSSRRPASTPTSSASATTSGCCAWGWRPTWSPGRATRSTTPTSSRIQTWPPSS